MFELAISIDTCSTDLIRLFWLNAYVERSNGLGITQKKKQLFQFENERRKNNETIANTITVRTHTLYIVTGLQLGIFAFKNITSNFNGDSFFFSGSPRTFPRSE